MARPVNAAEWLSLAAAPTFAAMALLTGTHGASMADTLCSAAPVLSGMAPMYWLMSAFHAGAWLHLINPRSDAR